MDVHKLKRLLSDEENPKLDFKAEFNINTDSEKKELVKDVIAMANSKGGRGYIIFGIEDKTKKVLGIEPEVFSEEQIQQIIYNRCYPPVPVSVDILEYEGKQIAVVTIFKSNQRPHQMIQNGSFYVRRGSTTDVARREEIASMFQENGLFSYERVILRNVPMEELDKTYIEKFFKYDSLLLEALGIIGKDIDNDEYHPTIGGMLLFGNNPYIFLPHVYIRIFYEEQVKLISGNIINMLDKTEEYIRSICNNPSYPVEAVLDAVSNAVVHRDYLDISRGIHIEITSNHIYITNPGAMISGNKVYKYYKRNYIQRRNPWLYQRLLTIDDKKRFLKYGLGMNRIKQRFEGMGNVKFVNLDSENLFKVVLPSFRNINKI